MSDLPVNIATKYDIRVVPGVVYINGEKYQSGIDLLTKDMERFIKNDQIIIKTGAPPPASYYEAYEKIYDDMDTIISLHCPRKHSGSLNAAKVAAKRFDDPSKIKHFECGVATLGLGLTAVATAITAKNCNNVNELIQTVEKYCNIIQVIGTLDSLKFVQKSGRIKLRVATWLANTLNIKPILVMRDSDVYLVNRSRKKQEALNIIRKILFNTIDKQIFPQIIGISNFCSEDDTENLKQNIGIDLPEYQLIEGYPDPMIVANTGPGLILIAYFSISDDITKGGRKINI